MGLQTTQANIGQDLNSTNDLKVEPLSGEMSVVAQYLDISALVLEIDPGMGVAPDQHGEEDARDGAGHQHDYDAKEPVVTQ